MSAIKFLSRFQGGPPPDEGYLKARTFAVKTMNDSQKLERVKNYYKMTIPLERLLSAIKDKFDTPLRYKYNKFIARHRMEIMRKFGNLEELKRWESGNRSIELRVTFPQYIQWDVSTNSSMLYEHFTPQIEDIYPCRMVHDVYGNFKQIGKDWAMIIKKIDAPKEYYPNASYHA